MPIEFSLARISHSAVEHPQVPSRPKQVAHTILRMNSISWKALAALALTLSGTPSAEASCSSYTDFVKFSVIKPTLAWIFPDLARREAPLPLHELLHKFVGICPTPDLSESEEQALRVDAAMFHPLTDSDEVMFNINKFGITNQSAIVEVFQRGIETDYSLSAALYWIRRCLFTNEADRIKLFMSGITNECLYVSGKCIKTDCGYVLEHYNEFEIYQSPFADQSDLIKLTEYMAKKCPRDTAEHFKKLQIRDSNERFRLAKECAQYDPISTARYIKNFDLKNEKSEQEIVAMAPK